MTGDAAFEGNPYRNTAWTTPELYAQKEHIQWIMAEADLEYEPVHRTNTLEFYELELKDVEDEIARRKRVQHSKYAPKFRKGASVDHSEQIRQIKERLPVEELLRRYGIELKKRGRNLVCNCPIPDHDDRTPSFNIYPDGGWYCFGCNRGGDIFELARWLLDEPSFTKVVNQLANEAGI